MAASSARTAETEVGEAPAGAFCRPCSALMISFVSRRAANASLELPPGCWTTLILIMLVRFFSIHFCCDEQLSGPGISPPATRASGSACRLVWALAAQPISKVSVVSLGEKEVG